MDTHFANYIAAPICFLIATYCFFWALLRLTQDSKEPPLAPGLIPYISPVIDMKQKKGRFYSHMKKTFPQPIYTLRLPGSRLYVINSTALIPAVQRQFRTLAFAPLQIKGTETILGASPEAMDIIDRNVIAGDTESFLDRLVRVFHPFLAPSASLDSLNKTAIQILEPYLDRFAEEADTVINMYDWVRKTVINATTGAVFGPKNPMKDPAILAAWLIFEKKVPLLTLGFLPHWIVKDGLEARETIVKAFGRYFADSGLDEASAYMQSRVKFYEQEGIPINDKARFEVGHLIALASNTVPTAFWFIYHIFSDPMILEECRTEVSNAVEGSHTISFERIKRSCPILQSVLWEVFRIHGIGLVPRRALDDVMLNDQYLIKKGGTVFIPYRVQHHDPSVWGENEAVFYYKRFVRQPGTKRHNPAAFRGFGSGAHLCPGRHFASAELLLLVAMMLLRFDVRPVSGHWPQISVENSSQVAAIDQPDHDFEVEVKPRDGVSQHGWNVDFSGSEQAVKMLGEDKGR